jgi:hypothetical protein
MKTRWGAAFTALMLVVATQVAVQWIAQGTSSAALPGARAVSDQTAFDREPEPKTARAKCPLGTRVTGGGGRVIGSTHVVITRMQPTHTNNPSVQDEYVVTAREDEVGANATWAVAAYALCATASPSLGIQIVSMRSPTQSSQNIRAAVNCPGQKAVLGTGARVNGGVGQVHLTELSMGELSTGTHVSIATAQEDNTGFNGQWSLDVFAVCANIPSQNHEVISGFAPGTPSQDRKLAPVTCPAGMSVTGVGATIMEPMSGRVVLEATVPEFLVGGVPGNEAFAIAREDVVNNDAWSLMVQAACVR